MRRATIIGWSAAAAAAFAVRRSLLMAAAPNAGVSAHEALSRLRSGNGRFVAGSLTHQNGVSERRLALTGHQAPFAAILSCSDSRVPPELVFDASVGDLFVARNAGNIATNTVIGTLEYGYSALGIKLIVVMGHEKCGAVSATYDALRERKPLPPNLDAIERGVAAGIERVVHERDALHAAVVANAEAQAAKLHASPVLGPALAKGACTVVAADYAFDTGQVAFLT